MIGDRAGSFNEHAHFEGLFNCDHVTFSGDEVVYLVFLFFNFKSSFPDADLIFCVILLFPPEHDEWVALFYWVDNK